MNHADWCPGSDEDDVLHALCPDGASAFEVCMRVVVWGPDSEPQTVWCGGCNSTHAVDVQAEDGAAP